MRTFTTDGSDLTVDNLRPLPSPPADDWVMNGYFDAFARIYYSSEAYDLGRPPTFGGAGAFNYTQSAICQMFIAVMHNWKSIDERATLVHNAWTHNYLVWQNRHDNVPRYDSLIVPFDDLPAFEKQKRYFCAELIHYIMHQMPTSWETDRFYASQSMELATYIVAYKLAQKVCGGIPDPNALIELNDNERDYLSSNLL